MTLENILSRSTVSGVDHQPKGAFSASTVKCPLNVQASTSISSSLPPTAIPRTLHFARGRSTQPSDNAVRLATELVQQRDQLGHYGLTAATVVCDQSTVGVFPHKSVAPPTIPLSSAPPSSRPAHAWRPPESGGCARPSPPSRLQRKRSVDASNLDKNFRVPVKKPRRPPPGRIDLGHIVPPQTLAEALPLVNGGSPLFFSSSSTSSSMSKRTPTNFGAIEPAGAMLNRLREEQGIVRTVKLPKGHVSLASPAKGHNMSTPGSISSDNVSSTSGDSRQLQPDLRDLQGLSVIDLIEADERPTFVIDLTKSSNFGPGPLELLFVNAAVRASQHINELISQSTEDSSEFSRFKAWAVSFVKNRAPMDVCMPSLSYGGMIWTCSTLANRFRFISGSASAVSITPTSPVPPARATSILEQRARLTPSHESVAPGRERALSDLDYFGDANLDTALISSRRARSEPRDLSDLRPATPVVQSQEPNVEPNESDLVQTFDWTRISDISGMFPPLLPFSRRCPQSAGYLCTLQSMSWTMRLLLGAHGKMFLQGVDITPYDIWDSRMIASGMNDVGIQALMIWPVHIHTACRGSWILFELGTAQRSMCRILVFMRGLSTI